MLDTGSYLRTRRLLGKVSEVCRKAENGTDLIVAVVEFLQPSD